ncbi:hypothetical protein [Hyphococcus luteus]|uniref:Uncharacterized protein n=1 Tax=Hyphococcus luteus TaxID=2058213 RepID=A0A2S7KAG6_9PROT|nr:hypothetical protein [Marinicaulis flavus]PQA89473.1 hypothetical protein CW354_00950 [Marinicaulis flavus]
MQLPAKDRSQETLDQVRVNIAFENMVVAVIAGAGAGGVMTFLVRLAGGVLQDFSFSVLLSAFLETLMTAFLIFLTGFISCVALGAPLFRLLEKRKQRSLWPYLAAALAIAVVVMLAASRGLPGPEDLHLETATAIFAPAVIIALIFSRQMRPHWRAAERAEEEPEAAGSNIIRLN